MSLLGARAQDNLWAKSITPSINYTTPKKIPVPYPVWEFLGVSVRTVSSVNLNNNQAYILNQSIIPHCRGDEPGSFGGVKSGTVSDEVEPIRGASGVTATGQPLIRKDDPCYMNKRNTQGIYQAMPVVPPAPPPAQKPQHQKDWREQVRDALGIASLIPGVGSITSVLDAGLYLSEGKLGNTGSVAASMALSGKPLVGTAMQVLGAAQSAFLKKPNTKQPRGAREWW